MTDNDSKPTSDVKSKYPYDAGYKHLFSHPPMIEDLLRGFVDADWVQKLDFKTLEKVSGSFVTEDLKHRQDDSIWRIQWPHESESKWIFIYILLEFQSTVDDTMALRILVYLGLLYQDLIKRNWATPTKLPPILPIVLYNGEDKWTARTNIKDLIPVYPKEFSAYLPSLPYLVLSEQHFDDEKLDLETQNFVKALFRLEKSRNSRDFVTVLKQLSEWLNSQPYDALSRAFTVFVKRIILPRRFKHEEQAILHEIRDLQEMSMLADRIEIWLDEAEQKGFEKAKAEYTTKMDSWLDQAEQKGFEKAKAEYTTKMDSWLDQAEQKGFAKAKAEYTTKMGSWLDEAEQKGFEKAKAEYTTKMDSWLEQAEQKGFAKAKAEYTTKMDSWLDEAEQKGFAKAKAEYTTKMDSWLDQAEQKGFAKAKAEYTTKMDSWLDQAEQKGFAKAKAETLQELLKFKFGELSAETVDYIHSLPKDKLNFCLSKLFSAQRIEDVLISED